MSKLSLDLFRRETLFCRCEQMHRDKPIPEWQLGFMHDSSTSQGGSCLTRLTFKLFLIFFPIMVLVPTFGTTDSNMLPVLLKLLLAALFVGVVRCEFDEVHIFFFQR